MDRLIENKDEGNWVDREYCAQVTLAYLANINYQQLIKDNPWN